MNKIITYKAENESEEINFSTNKALAVVNLRMMSHIGRPGLVWTQKIRLIFLSI